MSEDNYRRSLIYITIHMKALCLLTRMSFLQYRGECLCNNHIWEAVVVQCSSHWLQKGKYSACF